MAKLKIAKAYIGNTVHTAKKGSDGKLVTVSITLDEKTSAENLAWLKDVKGHPSVESA
jgi:hypothetical protein